MLCSSCNSVVNPVVAVDIDGTISEYHTHLMKFIAAYHNFSEREVSSLILESNGLAAWDGDGDFEEWLSLTREEYREAKLSFRQGGFKRWSPVFSGAHELIDGIRSLGVEVWFTTTRPWQRLDNVDPDTREWLHRNHFSYEGLLYDEDKYARLIEIVGSERIVGVIDDLPEMFDRADELGLPVFQVERNHNAHQTQMRRPRGTLLDALQWVTTNVERWENSERTTQLELFGKH